MTPSSPCLLRSPPDARTIAPEAQRGLSAAACAQKKLNGSGSGQAALGAASRRRRFHVLSSGLPACDGRIKARRQNCPPRAEEGEAGEAPDGAGGMIRRRQQGGKPNGFRAGCISPACFRKSPADGWTDAGDCVQWLPWGGILMDAEWMPPAGAL